MNTKSCAIALVTGGLLTGAALLGASNHITPQPLTSQALAQLEAMQDAPGLLGDQIYEGLVHALDERTEPLFRYERRVREHGATMSSTHVTYDDTGTIVVVQSAEHSPAYALTRAAMTHRQTGASAAVVVAHGKATFTRTEGGQETVRQEPVGDPVVAGPTMFGFILARWDELARGASIPIRFAVLERGETFGFVLDKVADANGRTTIRMKPGNLLVRLAVAPTYFQFDTASRRIVEYTGRVPPLERIGDRLETLDARVAYTFQAAAFR